MKTTSSRLLNWGTMAHGIRNADGSRDDDASWKVQMTQGRDFLKVHVHAGQEVRHETNQPNPDHCASEPESAGIEVKAHESHGRYHEHGEGDVRVASVGREVGRGDCAHSRELVGPVRRGRSREHEEQHVGVLRAVLLPDKQVDDAEHQARRDHHRPGGFKPIHRVNVTVGAEVNATAFSPPCSDGQSRLRVATIIFDRGGCTPRCGGAS